MSEYTSTALAIFFLVAGISIMSACVSSPIAIDTRYNFSGFEQVDSISRLNLQGWETIDNQSLIVQTGPSISYLLILRNRMPDLNFAETILFSATGNRIEAGINCVEVVGPSCTPESMPVVIDRIYKLDGREDIDRVRRQILGR